MSALLALGYLVSSLVGAGCAGSAPMATMLASPRQHGMQSTASEKSARVTFTKAVAALTSRSQTPSGTYAMVSPAANADDAAPGACVLTKFKTELVRQACAKGGQKEASEAMKKFDSEKKIKSCNQCHAKLAPKYELKPDGLEQFQKAGGK